MKLLVITQKIDKDDPVLGFFHRWVEEFAKHYEKVTIICLGKGNYNLPENVKVLSLGKEEKLGRLIYLCHFYKYIWGERRNYELVFVHMNQEYVLLGGLVWRFLGKKIYLWRNHLRGNFLTRIAVLLSNRVFCTSPQSFTAQFKKTELMPVGIDTDFFKPNPLILKKSNSILFLGRIAPVKNVDIFIATLGELQKLGVQFTATIAGSALPIDASYEKELKVKVARDGLTENVQFVGSVNQAEALKLYQEHELYVNLTPSGSMDKTIFEAMACGITPVVLNYDLKDILSGKLIALNPDPYEIAQKIKDTLTGQSKGFRDLVVEKHSIGSLVKNL